MGDGNWFDEPDGRPSPSGPVFDDDTSPHGGRGRLSDRVPRPPKRMILLGGAVLLTVVVAMGAATVSYDSRVAADRELTRCNTAARSLSEARNRRATAVDAAKRRIDMDLLAKADPRMHGEIRTLLAAKPSRVVSCDTDVSGRADSMERAADKASSEAKRLDALTGKAVDKSSAYRLAESSSRFDRALARAESLVSDPAFGSLSDSFLRGRLPQEIERAKSLPRSSGVNDLDTASSTLESLCDQVEEKLSH